MTQKPSAPLLFQMFVSGIFNLPLGISLFLSGFKYAQVPLNSAPTPPSEAGLLSMTPSNHSLISFLPFAIRLSRESFTLTYGHRFLTAHSLLSCNVPSAPTDLGQGHVRSSFSWPARILRGPSGACGSVDPNSHPPTLFSQPHP